MCLIRIKQPFWAVALWPGVFETKEHNRVYPNYERWQEVDMYLFSI